MQFLIRSTGSGVGSAVRGVNLLDVSAVTQNTTTYPATSQKTHPSDCNPPHTSGFTNSSGSSKEQGQGLRKKRRTLAAKVGILSDNDKHTVGSGSFTVTLPSLSPTHFYSPLSAMQTKGRISCGNRFVGTPPAPCSHLR